MVGSEEINLNSLIMQNQYINSIQIITHGDLVAILNINYLAKPFSNSKFGGKLNRPLNYFMLWFKKINLKNKASYYR